MPATIDGIPFYVNPSSIAWSYSVKVATHPTIGGKVVQLIGMNMGDLVVRGHFGGDAVNRQAAFFNRLLAIADRQRPGVNRVAVEPVRFVWPEQSWDFWVYLKQFEQAGAGVSIERNVKIFNPGYALTMFVYEDNGSIRELYEQQAQAKYIARLSAGLGWTQSEYNGPEHFEALQEKLAGSSLFDYAFTQYGLLPGVGQPVTTAPGTQPTLVPGEPQ